MAGGRQQPGGQSDESSTLVWLVGALIAGGAILWVVFKNQIIHYYFKIKLAEIDFLSLFTSQLDDARSVILNTDPSKLSFQEVISIGNAVGDFLRYPFALIIIVLAVVVFFSNSTRIFKKIYTMRDLVQLEKGNWPQITPVAPLDLIKTDIDKGPWAMALTPMQFCKRYHLLEEHKIPPREGMTHKEWNRVEVTLRRGQANKLFVVQLGPLWPGIDKVPLHVKALFAAFAARLNSDAKGAADLFMHISASSATKLDFSGTEELLKKYIDTKLVQRVMQSHAYLLTVMAEMLEAARTDGVQATADFLWLKPVDRRLWYMLNTVGRQTPFVEVAGPYAHWLAERELGKKLIVPVIEEATNALEAALKEIIYRPDEKE